MGRNLIFEKIKKIVEHVKNCFIDKRKGTVHNLYLQLMLYRIFEKLLNKYRGNHILLRLYFLQYK